LKRRAPSRSVLASAGRFAAVPFQIPPQEAARDRDVVQRLFA
jgi:hypothetical protein